MLAGIFVRYRLHQSEDFGIVCEGHENNDGVARAYEGNQEKYGNSARLRRTRILERDVQM